MRARGTEQESAPFVIVGGGIAGISCCEELARLRPTDDILLVSASAVLKGITNITRITDNLEEFEVMDRALASMSEQYPNVRVMQAEVGRIDHRYKKIVTKGEDGLQITFDKLCVCTGARPRLIFNHPRVIGIRDTESVEVLHERLSSAQKVVVVGNGGIALELVHSIDKCEVVWVIKNGYVGNTFLDASASAFLLNMPSGTADISQEKDTDESVKTTSSKETCNSNKQCTCCARGSRGWNIFAQNANGLTVKQNISSLYQSDEIVKTEAVVKKPHGERASRCPTAGESRSGGSALGPFWFSEPRLEKGPNPKGVTFEFETEIHTIRECSEETEARPLSVHLSSGKVISCDFVISATGVIPVLPDLGDDFDYDEEGALMVDEQMRSRRNVSIFAAGDCCRTLEHDLYRVVRQQDEDWSPHWFQMRLWGQAKMMGQLAGQSMAEALDDFGCGFCFELFAHVTRFFGHKVILLGQYNGQNLSTDEKKIIQQQVVTQYGPVADDTKGRKMAQGVKEEESAKTENSCQTEPADCCRSSSTTPITLLMRVTPGVEYIKIVLYNGRVIGAILIGDTDLEETLENLILNKLDVSMFGIDLLSSDVDIADYFD